MKALMEKQVAPTDKRQAIQLNVATKASLDRLKEEYNATYDEVVVALLRFYNANKGE
jgi:hypothetical protein